MEELRSMYTRDPTAMVLIHCNNGRHRTPPLVIAMAKALGSTDSKDSIADDICELRDPELAGYHFLIVRVRFVSLASSHVI